MKGLIWLLAAFAAAAALAVAARFDQGYVQVAWGQWRVELSLLFAALVVLGAFAALYALVRLARHTLALPTYVGAWRARRRREKAQEALGAALQGWLEGRYVRAEKEAARAWEGGAAAGVAAVIAARAAHELGAPERREQWLARADAAGAQSAAYLSRAVMALAERDYARARESLRSLLDSGGRHIATLRLLMRAERGMRNWDQVLRLTAQLAKRDAIAPGLAEDFRSQAHVELLAQAAAERGKLEERWDRIPSRERANARVAAAAARHATALGLAPLAREALEEALAVDWDAALIGLYGELPRMEPAARLAEARQRIERAERWLLEREQDAALLGALGRLCVEAELWGKAQSYLEASLAFGETRDTHLALARLHERFSRSAEAQRHYRRAADL